MSAEIRRSELCAAAGGSCDDIDTAEHLRHLCDQQCAGAHGLHVVDTAVHACDVEDVGPVAVSLHVHLRVATIAQELIEGCGGLYLKHRCDGAVGEVRQLDRDELDVHATQCGECSR